jgi:hypothetical protein
MDEMVKRCAQEVRQVGLEKIVLKAREARKRRRWRQKVRE